MVKKILTILVILAFCAIPLSYLDYNFAEKSVFYISNGIGYQSSKEIILDESGVPYIEYKYQNGEYVGEKRRNPVTISQTAMNYLDSYNETNDIQYKDLFLNCSNWLVENAVERDNYSVWEYSSIISYPNFVLNPPWVSAMAQGQAIQVLAYAYDLTGDKKYLNTAKSALNSFYVLVENGGVLHIDEDGGWWYLEYCYKEQPKPRTLNGFIFALIGIHEYYTITNDENALFLFDEGVNELKNHLSDYDTGSYTVYDVVGTPAGKYHQIHVDQMLLMYNLTKDPLFLDYHTKWEGYSEDNINILTKNILKRLNVAIYIFNLSILYGIAFIFLLFKHYGEKKV
ncbi:MAG: D-glucuronyl C5-epimerase family protein [Methanosarcinaceae archaeon]